MRAAWYERQGPADDVLVVGEMPDPEPGQGEALASGWAGLPIAQRLPLADIARAHALVEQGTLGGRVVLML